jgi:colanic acid/amylovoran biosynthesis glycosyltransferase
VWLAHYGRWGQFACHLRTLGLIAGPIATMFHGRDMSVYLERRTDPYADLMRQGDLFLPIADLWRAKLLEMGAPPAKTLTHRMGVDVARFAFAARSCAPGETVRFVGVGRMVAKKGFDDAIAALTRVPGASLTLIGDGRLRAGLEAQAAATGASVRFAGRLSGAEVAAELARAHLFVLPSKTAPDGDREGVPVALMEAMAQGLPVLSTRHSAIPELVEDGVSGLLSAEGDVAGLAANMTALARAPERWPAMGAAGAARVRADFNIDRWNDLLVERLGALKR